MTANKIIPPSGTPESGKIYHCSASLAVGGGGVKTYVDGLLAAVPDLFSTQMLPSLQGLDQSRFRLVHIHEVQRLSEVSGACPVVFTAHNHDAYCPSGNKYLSHTKQICEQAYDPLGCGVSHVVAGCGSKRPQRIIENVQRAGASLAALKTKKITVIANSEYVRQEFIRNGLPESQVITLKYGIREPAAPPTPLTEAIHQQQRIFFGGRIVPEKGLDWLLETMLLLDRRIHLDVAGEGWDMARMQRRTKDLGLMDRVTWHGWCSGAKLEELYRGAFVAVFPSVWPEPAGIITLEAYARYRPVVASAVGGIPEHVRDGQTGILVNLNDRQGLADAIITLADNLPMAQAMGAAGYDWFHEEFTIPDHVVQLQRIYEQVIASHGLPS